MEPTRFQTVRAIEATTMTLPGNVVNGLDIIRNLLSTRLFFTPTDAQVLEFVVGKVVQDIQDGWTVTGINQKMPKASPPMMPDVLPTRHDALYTVRPELNPDDTFLVAAPNSPVTEIWQKLPDAVLLRQKLPFVGSPPLALPRVMIQQMQRREKINAIKSFREVSQAPLKEAKDYVESIIDYYESTNKA